DDRRLGHRERGAEQVLRIRRQAVRDPAAGGTERARIARERHPVAAHDDLTPANAPRAGPIDEPDLGGAGKRREEWGRVLTNEPHRREPAGPGRKAQSGRLDAEGEWTTAGRQGQARRESIAGDLALGLRLGAGDLGVAVGVDPLALGERRDLGLVDDDVEVDFRRLDADAGVVVDREVPKRMSEDRDGGYREESDRRKRRCEDPNAPRSVWPNRMAVCHSGV